MEGPPRSLLRLGLGHADQDRAQVRRGRGLRHAARDPGDLDAEADLEGVPQDDRRTPGHAHRRDDARASLRPQAGGRCRGAGGRRPLHHRHGPLRQRRADAARRPDGRDPLAPRPALQLRLDAGGALVELGSQGCALLLRPLRGQRDPAHRMGRRTALGHRLRPRSRQALPMALLQEARADSGGILDPASARKSRRSSTTRESSRPVARHLGSGGRLCRSRPPASAPIPSRPTCRAWPG